MTSRDDQCRLVHLLGRFIAQGRNVFRLPLQHPTFCPFLGVDSGRNSNPLWSRSRVPVDMKLDDPIDELLGLRNGNNDVC